MTMIRYLESILSKKVLAVTIVCLIFIIYGVVITILYIKLDSGTMPQNEKEINTIELLEGKLNQCYRDNYNSFFNKSK